MNPSNNSPALSIVMPVFNHPNFVAVMIDSIVRNDFADWELLAVDDGSDAETLSLLRKYAAADQRILLVQRERQPKGAQTCRNIGMERAQSEFIVFFDSDDFVAPHCLRQRVEAMRQNPGMDFLVFPSGTYEQEQFRPDAKQYVYGYPIYSNDLKAFSRRTLPFIVWNNIYRLSALRDRQLQWNEQLRALQDADFNVAALLAGLRYSYVQAAPDYGYRINSSSASVSKKIVSDELRRNNLYATELACERLQSHCQHRYDHDLYRGVLTIYNRVFTDGVDWDYASGFVNILLQRTPFWGKVLRLQVKASRLLARFLPAKAARQLPMACHLLTTTFARKFLHPLCIKKKWWRNRNVIKR